MNLKLSKKDWFYILGLIIFLAILTYPNYTSKGDCEVARAGFKCDSVKNVMVENCQYWSQYSCDSSRDVGLTQVEWYLGNLCKLQNQYHNSGLDCSNLKAACNQITQANTCPI